MAYNNDNAQAFRSDYRAGIHPLYNPWLHAVFVQTYGLLCIVWLWSTLESVAPWQWLLVPATLVFFSCAQAPRAQQDALRQTLLQTPYRRSPQLLRRDADALRNAA